MNYFLISIAFVCIATAICIIIYKKRSSRDPEKILRDKIKKSLNTEDRKAEMIIDDYLNRLKERIPGKSMHWYLEKVLYDFDRDR